MRFYTIHEGPPEKDGTPRLAAVKEGFCWPALFLSAIWSLWHGLWLVTFFIAAANMAVGWLLGVLNADPMAISAFNIAFNVIVALVANDLRRWTLAGRGYEEMDVVSATGADEALHKFLSAMAARAEAQTARTPAHATHDSALPPSPPNPYLAEPFSQP